MKVKVEKQPKSQLKISVTVPNEKVKEAYSQILAQAVLDTEVPGFRKGKAPTDKVEAKLGVSKLYGDAINQLLQTYYSQALKENHINPISNPKVEVKEFDLEKDFEFDALVAIKPDIKVKDFRKDLEKYFEDKKKAVKKENEEKLKKGEKIESDHVHLHPNEVVEKIIDSTEVDVPGILVEEETNRLIARLVDQVISAGMKTEDYLGAQGITMDQLKDNYSKVAERNIIAELALNELINTEKVDVKDSEVEEAIKGLAGQASEEDLNSPVQKIYVRTILEKNKLITNLIKEIEGDNFHE